MKVKEENTLMFIKICSVLAWNNKTRRQYTFNLFNGFGFFSQTINLNQYGFDAKLVLVIFQYYKTVHMGSFYFDLF